MLITNENEILSLLDNEEENKDRLSVFIKSDNLEGKNIYEVDPRIRKTIFTRKKVIFAFRPYWIGKNFVWLKKATLIQRLNIINTRENYDEFGQMWWHKAKIIWDTEYIEKIK